VNGTLFFTAYDGSSTSKLWTSDGTADGTVPVVDQRVGYPTNFNGTVYFSTDDGTHGTELWKLVEGPPAVTVDDVMVTEGNGGTASAAFTVRLSEASTVPVTVAYATANGSASAGSDYQAASGSVTFAPGETSKSITVQVNGDRRGEADESFYVDLGVATNATVVDGRGVGTVRDDEPRVSISDVTRAEGKKGQTTLFTFTVTLSAAYDQAVTMSYRTADGTATTGNSDYVAKSGTLTFAPGETLKTITITVKGDGRREADEAFYLDLSGISDNALLTKHRGIGKILNDD
jgi:ELWxxDGT repeat protein